MNASTFDPIQGLAATTIQNTTQDKAQLLEGKVQDKISTLAGNPNIRAITDKKHTYTAGQRPDLINTKTPEQLQEELGWAATYQVFDSPDGSKYQFARNADGTYAHDTSGNWIEQPYRGKLENAYVDTTAEGNYKFGLASPDVKPGYTPFEARYMDKTHENPYTYNDYKEKGQIVYNPDGSRKVGYDGTPGPRGVTPRDGALMDITLPYNVAAQLEYDIHSNAGQLASRAMGQGGKTAETERMFGAGQTEYTTPDAPLWNVNYDMKNAKIAADTVLPHTVTTGTAQEQGQRYTAEELNKLMGIGGEELPSNNIMRGVGAATLDVGAKAGSLIGRGVEAVGQVTGSETAKGVGKTIQDAYTKFQTKQMGKEMTGYNDKDAQSLQQEIGDTIKKDGYLAALGKAVTDSRSLEVLATSVPEMIALAASVGTMAIANANNDINIGQTNLGREYTPEEKAMATVSSVVGTYLDRLGDKLALSGMNGAKMALKEAVEKAPVGVQEALASKYGKGILAIGEVPLKLAGAAGVEGGTEWAQTLTQNAAQNPEIFKNGLSDKDYEEAGVAGVLGAAMGTHMSVPTVAKDMVVDTLEDRKFNPKQKDVLEKEDTPVELTPKDKEELATFAGGLSEGTVDLKSDPKAVMDKIYKYEELLRRAKEGASKEAIKEEFTKAKETLNKHLLEMDDEKPLTFGSRQDAENYIGFMVENNRDEKGELAAEIDSKLSKVANAAGIDEAGYKRLKDSAIVDEEAKNGKRGYNTYAREIQGLMNTDKVDPKLLTKKVRQATNFLKSQERYVSELEAGIKQAQDLVDVGNKTGILPKKKVPIKIEQDNSTSEYDIHITGDGKGQYAVHPAALSLLEAKRGNVEGIKEALKHVSKDLKKNKVETSMKEGVLVPVADSKDIESRRVKDRTYYTNHGVTKIILGDKYSDKWKHYKSHNEDIINSGTYSKDDKVLINATSLDTVGKMKVLDKNTQTELKKAMKAGATIVVDRDLLPLQKPKKGDADFNVKMKAFKERNEAYVAIHRQLSRFASKDRKYAGSISEDTGKLKIGVYRPVNEAEEISNKAKEVAGKKKEAKKKVEDAEAAVDDYVIETLVDTEFGKDPSWEGLDKESQEKVLSEIGDNYKGDTDKIIAHSVNKINKILDKAEEKVLEDSQFSIHETEISDSVIKDLGDARLVTLLTRRLIEKEEIVSSTENKLEELAMYKHKVESGVEGAEEELEKFLSQFKTNELDEILDNSSSKGMEDIYPYQYEVDGKMKYGYATSKDKIPSKAVWQSRIALDVSKYVGTKTTALNMAKVEELGDPVLIKFAKDGVKGLTKYLQKKNADATKLKYDFYNSPARGLVFDKDYNVNENVAAVMMVALGEVLTTDGYMLSDGYKSNEELANMLGVSEYDITREIRDLVGDKGMLQTTALSSVGASIAANLGLTAKSNSDTDAQTFDALKADLANMALIVAAGSGVVKFGEVSAKDYAEVVLGIKDSDVDSKATVKFVKLVSDKNGENKVKDTLVDGYQHIRGVVPVENASRKEWYNRKLGKKEIAKAIEGARKDISMMKIPKQAQEALTGLMEQEWTVDVAGIKDTLELLKDGKKLLGYVEIGSDEYESMSKDVKDKQAAINRAIDKSIDELGKITEGKAEDELPSVWFKWFYTKNQRYMMDSNTINPQTGKQLERFLVYPKDFRRAYKFEKIDGQYKFVAGGKDVTTEIKASIAQAFGFGIDKKNSKDAIVLADKLLALSKDELKELKEFMFSGKIPEGKKEFYKGVKPGHGVFKDKDGNKIEVEAEHFGHTVMAMRLLEELTQGKKMVTTPLSSEYDAVTSGFGLKQMQMPMDKDGEYVHQQRTGVFVRSGKFAGYDGEILIPEVFGNKKELGMNDSYEGLGIQMPSKEEMASEEKRAEYFTPGTKDDKTMVFIKANIAKSKWKVISSMIPGKDEEGNITKALRDTFKYPFMTFNYASSIRSVRALLANTLTESMIDKMYNAEKPEDVAQWEVFVKAINPKLTLAGIKESLKDTNSNKVIVAGHISLFDYVSKVIDASIGKEAETIFNREFKDYIRAQEAVVNGFSAVAEVFLLEYEAGLAELRKEGHVTKQDLDKLLAGLKDKFPMIKGPLSEAEIGPDFDGVGIMDSKKVLPSSTTYGGREAAQTKLDRENAKEIAGLDHASVVANYKIKKMVAAIKAGAVIPIHALDGAIMGKLINWCKESGIGIVAIHDAIIVAPRHINEVTGKYNELMYEVNKEYNLLGEVKGMLDRVVGSIDLSDKKYKVPYKGKFKTDDGSYKVSEKKLVDFIEASVKDMNKEVEMNDKAREKFHEAIKENGAYFNHMASLPGGGFEVKVKAEANEKLDTIRKKYNMAETEFNTLRDEMKRNCQR